MVNWQLTNDDSLEHMLTRIGAEINYRLTGDYAAYRDLLSCKPPGGADVVPSWRVVESRDLAKALHTQGTRVKKGKGGGRSSSSDSDGKAAKPRRRRKKKSTSSSAQSGDAGKGGGKKEDGK